MGSSQMHTFPCSPSPSDVLEDFVPYPRLSLTAPSLSHILQLTCHIFRSFLLPSGKLSSSVLREAFSAHVPTGSSPCPLPLTTLLCRQSSRAVLARLRLPVSSPPVFKDSVPNCCGSWHLCQHPATATKTTAEILPGAFLSTGMVPVRAWGHVGRMLESGKGSGRGSCLSAPWGWDLQHLVGLPVGLRLGSSAVAKDLENKVTGERIKCGDTEPASALGRCPHLLPRC